MQLKGPY